MVQCTKGGQELTVSYALTEYAGPVAGASNSPKTVKSIRDPRLDIIRGIAMVTMVADHFTEAVFPFTNWHLLWRVPSPTYYGLSSAAEIFVTLSGYMVGMVYLGKTDGVRRVLNRAATLYILSFITILLVTPFALISSAPLAHYLKSQIILSPWGVFRDAAILYKFPTLIDVLGLYVMFMTVAPLSMMVAKWKPLALAAISILIWLVLRPHSIRELVPLFNQPVNPFAWQLLFFVPMLLGASRFHEPFFSFFENRPYLFAMLSAIMIAIAVKRVGHILGHGGSIPWSDKYFLGMSRIAGNALLISFYASSLGMLKKHLSLSPLRILASIGRNSLYCFIGSIVATYALVCLWEYAVPTYAGYLAVSVMILTIVAALAWALDQFTQRKAARKRALAQSYI